MPASGWISDPAIERDEAVPRHAAVNAAILSATNHPLAWPFLLVVKPQVELPFPTRPDVLEVRAPRDVVAEHEVTAETHP